ncbi:MAG: hypothetical protein ACI9R3_004292 [Verrucomicrobiales bacterium]|jgi:hypothetical protein
MLKGDSLRKADIVTGFLMILTGAAVILGGSKMPMGGTYGGVDNPWYASPAAFPLLLGSLLAIGGAAVAAKGIRMVGLSGLGAFLARVILAPIQRPAAKRGALVVAVLGCYYLLLRLQLFGTANYMVSSAAFLAGLALLFIDHPHKCPQRK